MKTKYPNANTSPERLEELLKEYKFLEGVGTPARPQTTDLCAVYDLLAILEKKQEETHGQYSR